VGHLTGTTALNAIKAIKFVLLDDQTLPGTFRHLLQLLGLSLERKSRQSISRLLLASLKKAYKALGLKSTTTTSTPNQTMIDAISKQHPSHVPSNITTLVQEKFILSSAGKRKRREAADHDIGEVEQGNADEVDATLVQDHVGAEDCELGDQTAGTPVKKIFDNRKWCFRCTYKVRMGVDGRSPKNVSRLDGLKPKKTSSFCMRCQVALCKDCFRPWHDEEGLPPTTPTA
jgi:hypothetical protein